MVINKPSGGTVSEAQNNPLPTQNKEHSSINKNVLGNAKSDTRIAADIGQRLDRLRLEQNLTQQQLADELGITRVSYRNLINGKGKFTNIVALLRALGRLDLLDNFVPDTAFSPMAQLKNQGKQRQRARQKKKDQKKKDKSASSDTNQLDW